ncbi:hypothetical protein AT5A_27809, partial [Agrobacterium tumefaciens 5A]
GVQRITRRHSLKRSGDMMICYVPRIFAQRLPHAAAIVNHFVQLLIGQMIRI